MVAILYIQALMNIKKLQWEQAKHLLQAVNPKLSRAVEACPATSKYPFYLVSYEYGEIITSPEIEFQYPKNVFGNLWSKTIPFSVVIDKSFEMFIDFMGKTFCYRVYGKGEIFRTFEFIENYLNKFTPADIISVSSGARNTFLLPSISHSIPHKNLCAHFDKNLTKPNSIDDHFFIFRDLASTAKVDWRSQLLCFDKKWVNETKASRPHKFIQYIKSYNSKFEAYSRSLTFYEFLLSYIRAEYCSPKITNYMYDIIKQFYGIACSTVTGYSPIVNDDSLPYKFISETYRDIYKLKSIPFGMTPSWFNEDNNPIYYSLIKEGMIFKPKTILSTLQASVQIKEWFSLFNKKIVELDMYKNTKFRYCAENIKTSVFHDSGDNHKDVLNTHTDLFKYDKRFKEVAQALNLPLSAYITNSTFFTGSFGLRY